MLETKCLVPPPPDLHSPLHHTALSNILNPGALMVGCVIVKGLIKSGWKRKGWCRGCGRNVLKNAVTKWIKLRVRLLRKAAAAGIKKQSLKLHGRHWGIKRRDREDVIYWLQRSIFPSGAGEFPGVNKVPGVPRTVGGRRLRVQVTDREELGGGQARAGEREERRGTRGVNPVGVCILLATSRRLTMCWREKINTEMKGWWR